MFRCGPKWLALTIVPSLACIAGCTSGAATVPPRSVSAALLAPGPDAQHYGNDWMFSTTPGGNDAPVYRRKGTQLTYNETLSTGLSTPQGTVATRSGWWYVTNAGDANVLIYRTTAKGPKGPIGSPLDDNGEVPINIAVTPDRNLVAVSNASSAGSGTGNVSIYLNRATEASRTLTYGSDLVTGEGIAVDHQGNCYWSFDDVSKPSTLGSIVKFAHCNGGGTPVVSGIVNAGGLVFDTHGDLYYIDETSGIYRCQGTSHCQLFASGFGLPVTLNFDANDKHLWVADAAGYLDAVNPQTGQIESQTVSVNGDPFGIAPSPGN